MSRRPAWLFVGSRVLPRAVLGLLVAAAVVPSGAVLWFMNEALEKERVALQARLLEAYRGQVSSVAASLRASWRSQREALERPHEDPIETWARVRANLADAAIVLDDAGRVLYPDAPRSPRTDSLDTPLWRDARRWEDGGDPARAAVVYHRIARTAPSAHEAAQAVRAQARCLARTGRGDDAVDLLVAPAFTDRFAAVRDGSGRLVVPDALLLALQVSSDRTGAGYRRARERLVARLSSYDAPHLPASQRRFLYDELRSVWRECPLLPALAAEDLAAAYLSTRVPGPLPERLTRTPVPGVLALASPGRRVIALYREERVASVTRALLQFESTLKGGQLVLTRPGEPPPPGTIASALVGEAMGDWGVALQLGGPDPFASAFVRTRSTYLWAAGLILATIAAGSFLTGRALGREVRLTRLKNDLIATVSHEMRTPVASMRVLLDNLADGGVDDGRQVREYVSLLSRENRRLGALVESFLTFSRLENGRWPLERAPVSVDDIVRGALESLDERLQAAGCAVATDVAPDLPAVAGDRAALVTVVSNLVDNALKYSGEGKRIAVRARPAEGAVVIEVEDNGVGFSWREARRLFEPFYQADRRLSREAGGCGLGLSIVKSIVEAHHGQVEARGEPGKGATFSVTLPA